MLGKSGLLNTRIGLILIYSVPQHQLRDLDDAELPGRDPARHRGGGDGGRRHAADRAAARGAAAGRAGPRRHRDLQRDRHLQRLPAGAVADLDADRPDRAGGCLHADRQDPDRVRADGRRRRGRRAADRHLRAASCSATSCAGSRSARSSERTAADHRPGAGRVPGGAAGGARRRRRRRCSPACSASSATATSPASVRRCSSTAACATSCPETSRRWCTPRWPTPSSRNRLQTLGLHLVDRAGRDQHGHRRGAGHDQPAAGAAAARRRVRHPAGQPGAAAAGAARPPRRLGQRHASRRCRASSTASTGPISCPVAARGDARADRPGRDRRRHDRAAPGRAGRGADFPEELFAPRVVARSPGRCPTAEPLAAGRRRCCGRRDAR